MCYYIHLSPYGSNESYFLIKFCVGVCMCVCMGVYLCLCIFVFLCLREYPMACMRRSENNFVESRLSCIYVGFRVQTQVSISQ